MDNQSSTIPNSQMKKGFALPFKAKAILILMAMIAVLLVIYSYFSDKSPKPATTGGVIPYSPVIPNFTKQKIELINKLTEEDFNFPSTLPALEVTKLPALTDSESRAIGTGFGFSNPPKIVQDTIDGATYIYSSQKDSLVIYLRLRSINYTTNQTSEAINKQLSDSALTEIARSFLSEKLSVNKESIASSSVSYLTSNIEERISKSQRSSADIFLVNLYPKTSSGTKVITLDGINSPFQVWIKKDGTILKSLATLTGGFRETSESFKISTFTEFSQKFDTAKLLSLDGGNINLSTLSAKQVGDITVNKVELVYLADSPTSPLYQPFFLLTGSTIEIGKTDPIEAILVLPAISTLTNIPLTN